LPKSIGPDADRNQHRDVLDFTRPASLQDHSVQIQVRKLAGDLAVALRFNVPVDLLVQRRDRSRAHLVAMILVARVLRQVSFGELGLIESTLGMARLMAGLGLGETATRFVAKYATSDPLRAGRVIPLITSVSIGTVLLGDPQENVGEVLQPQNVRLRYQYLD
jgi:hypothetical protein